MRRRIALAGLAALACLALARPAACAEGPLESAALGWLRLLDDGRFEEAWAAASPVLRAGRAREDWIAATRSLRESLGPVSTRSVADKAYHTQLEGGPDGHYFTLRLQSRLADGGERQELVTLVADPDAEYRVATYGVRR